jgi:uncharacterized delta-60 repeat protein
VANAVALQTDGKIIAAGYYDNGTNFDFAVVRYTTAGVLDPIFGSGGKVTTPIGSDHDEAFSVAIQTDGKIVVGGWSIGTTYDSFALVRYTTTGTLDGTFGTGGIVTTNFGASSGISSIALQSDGNIIAVGRYHNGTNNDFALARYTSAGVLDNTFGTGGMVITNASSSNDELNGVIVDGNGKIVVAGRAYNGSNVDFAVARYSSDGNLDATFGTGGITLTDFPYHKSDIAQALSIQPDGKIVLAGYSNNVNTGTNNDFALARYNTDGALDNSFGTNGKTTIDFAGPYDQAYAIAIQPDYKIVVAGEAVPGSNYTFTLARLKSQESPLPVELTSFTASTTGSTVKLNWQTATEVNNYGFEILRSAQNDKWEKIGFAQGHGNSNSPKEYSFTDNPKGGNSFKYRLKQIDFDGKYEYSDVVEVNLGTPANFAVRQNYPNPFNPTTKIKYQLPQNSFVTIKVFDAIGREVKTLVNQHETTGFHEISFNGKELSSGMYIYRIQSGKFIQTKKMLLMK